MLQTKMNIGVFLSQRNAIMYRLKCNPVILDNSLSSSMHPFFCWIYFLWIIEQLVNPMQHKAKAKEIKALELTILCAAAPSYIIRNESHYKSYFLLQNSQLVCLLLKLLFLPRSNWVWMIVSISFHSFLFRFPLHCRSAPPLCSSQRSSLVLS